MRISAVAFAIAIVLVASFAGPSFAQDNTQTQAPAAQTSNGSPDQTQSATNSSPDAANASGATPGDAPKATHNKSKNDIDDIGDRNVGKTGKSMGDWYSVDTDIKMGKQYAMMVESSARMVQDPVVTEYVNRVGQNLVRNSDAKVPFTIKVVDSDDINAFALPGGFFYVNSGLILAADDEAELAGVMAHEIAHVAARHATREMTRANYVSLASVPLMFIPSWGLYEAASAGLSLALPVTFMHFSRSFEGEADYLGLQYMYKAGYDPQAFISFFEKIKAREKQKPGTLAKAFSTHPQTPDRILKSQQEIRDILPARPEYIVDTSEFDVVKARLAALESRNKVIQEKNKPNQPTLRRTQTADNGKGQPDDKGDDRPTLQRRDDYASNRGLQ
jgi:predicted Zn-dependent protease